jgi:hypothetical protein
MCILKGKTGFVVLNGRYWHYGPKATEFSDSAAEFMVARLRATGHKVKKVCVK